MPIGNTENVDKNMESLFSQLDEVIGQAKNDKCSKQEKQDKYYGVTAKVKEDKLVLYVMCTTKNKGRIFTRIIDVQVDQNMQKERSCQLQRNEVSINNSHDKRVCTLAHEHMGDFLSLREQIKNMETPELHPRGVPMIEVRQKLLGASQPANYIADNTQSSQSATSSDVLPQKRTSTTTVAVNDSDTATRMTSIDKKMSTSTESSTSLDLTVRENKVNTSTTEDSTEMFLIKEDPQTDNSSRVEDISTSTPYSTLKSSPTSGTALRRRGNNTSTPHSISTSTPYYQASSTQSLVGLSTTGPGYVTNNTVSNTSVVSSNNSSQYSTGLFVGLAAGGVGLLVLLVVAAVYLYRYCFTGKAIDSSNVTSYRHPNKKSGNSEGDVSQNLIAGDQDVPPHIGDMEMSLVTGQTGQGVSWSFPS